MLQFSNTMLRQITPEAFALLGTPELAYIHPVTTPEGQLYGIFSASGDQVGVAESSEIAFAAARQHGLEPVSVH
jgi:hypothetical protein